MRDINAVLTIATRDFTKLLRDKTRLIGGLIFPFVFMGILAPSLHAGFGEAIGYNFIAFVFAGVLGQTLFQSTASGIISLIQDRESDFAQEMFVSPISRYSIIAGKILGESLVSLVQTIGIFIFALIMGVPLSFGSILLLIPASVIICLLGGAFGVMVLASLSSQRSANQIFPFLIFPQFFLAGVFNPIRELPLYLEILTRIAPMTYAVDLARNAYYWGKPEYSKVVVYSPLVDLAVIGGMIVGFIIVGTYLFVRNERNR